MLIITENKVIRFDIEKGENVFSIEQITGNPEYYETVGIVNLNYIENLVNDEIWGDEVLEKARKLYKQHIDSSDNLMKDLNCFIFKSDDSGVDLFCTLTKKDEQITTFANDIIDYLELDAEAFTDEEILNKIKNNELDFNEEIEDQIFNLISFKNQ